MRLQAFKAYTTKLVKKAERSGRELWSEEQRNNSFLVVMADGVDTA